MLVHTGIKDLKLFGYNMICGDDERHCGLMVMTQHFECCNPRSIRGRAYSPKWLT